MEIELVRSTAVVFDPGSHFFYSVVGTEQGLQMRVTTVDAAGKIMTQRDLLSISYEECLRLSYDMEKGKLEPRYGTPGSGLETDNPGWKRSTDPDTPGADAISDE